ncbi:MAG: protease inhibitor I42 family protein [Clostridia bacterium]|nr:protease inhibitor I42 family protein [Clostridia bacterium]
MIKKKMPLLFAAAWALSLCACGHTTIEEPATAAPITLPAVQKAETTEPTTEDETQPEETTGEFEFDEEEAERVGVINSPIYGKLYLYYQDGMLVIFDSYDTELFTVRAHGFSPEKAEELTNRQDEILLCGDMNFDGDLDFRLLRDKTSLNSYYDCWLWDMENKRFTYFSPLANIPNPDFVTQEKKVVSYNRLNYQNAIVTEYVWQADELLPVSHREIDNGNEIFVGGPEDVDTPVAIFDGLPLSGISLQGNADSDSSWLVKIEDETIVSLFSSEYNDVNHTYRFIFSGLRPGTTTVVLKYATDWDADYIASRVLNITVCDDLTLRIINV